ncbi:hypothetical protein [Pararhizobium sp. DWP3-4]|uniref:hypothetical protein n=1 Tax=Pararhizobium sp. DWP3-4 TaxID=2804565 RepID=UPI003CF1D9FA
MKIGRAFAIASFFSVATGALADVVTLAELTDADRTIIKRGFSLPDGVCANEIIDEVEAYGGSEAMKEFTIDVDRVPLTIESSRRDFKHICENGVHTTIENGRSTITQKYDEHGNPKLMEP